MSISRLTRATIVVLAMAVAGVPVARKLCGLVCEAAPALADNGSAAHAPHCAAHPAVPSEPEPPGPRPNPCGHGHGGDGALRTASSSLAKSGERAAGAPVALAVPAAEAGRAVPFAWRRDVDRRQALPPPVARRPILRL